MQSSSCELGTAAADNIYTIEYLCKKKKKSFAYAKRNDSFWVRYPTDFMSVGFRSQLEATHVSSHIEVL